MSWFDSLVIQPIFNLLMALYSALPGNDFGLTVIIFAVVVRVAMWPLIKKQLHQTKLQRQIQPELKRIKQQAAGNKQLEGQLMMELFRERGVSPFAPFAVAAVQIPVFIALYQIVIMVSNHRDKIDHFLYGFMKSWDPIASILTNTNNFNEKLFGLIDLTHPVITQGKWYMPAFALAVIATFFQWYQSKQITPTVKDGKKLKTILDEKKKSGEGLDASDVNAVVGQNLLKIIPFIALPSMVLLPIPGALLLFYAVSSIVAVWQQRSVLMDDMKEMEVIAETPDTPAKNKRADKVAQAVEAEVVERRVKKPVQKRRKGSKVR